MLILTCDRLSPAIRALASGDLPAGIRCAGVLAGTFGGTIFTDSLDHPAWVVVRENVYGTLYPFGAITKDLLTDLVGEFRQQGGALIGFWPGDPIAAVLPDAPQYEGAVFDFWDRAGDLDRLLAVPEGCEVRPLDAGLHRQSPWYADRLQAHGSIEAVLAKEIGFGLVGGGVLLSEASAALIAPGVMEVGTITHAEHRGRGYATVVSAACIRECERRDFQTYWNCNRENAPSVALAKKLGYRTAREYRLVGWFPRK